MGLLAPPTPILRTLEEQVVRAVESEIVLSEPQFADRIEGLMDDAVDGWLEDERARGLTRIGLEQAADLLLWLYGRVPLDTRAVPAELLAAFRALTSTD